jgi:hypothetical protein
MIAHMMALPSDDGGFRAGGLPIRLLAEDVIRRARAGLAQRDAVASPAPAAASEAPIASATPAAAAIADTSSLDRTLRGFTLLDLYVEARRSASAAAAEFEHLEGLAAGRTYGAPGLQPGFLTPESYRRAAADAKGRAEMAGATADFLRGMLGHEGALADLLTVRQDPAP